MKDIKTLMIGFLLATCMFLIMGQNRNESQIGKYQAYSSGTNHYLVETTRGDLFIREKTRDGHYVWKLILYSNS